MDPLVVIACMALLLCLVLYVSVPFFSPPAVPVSRSAGDGLRERQGQLYGAIVELDFDRQLGKLDEEDYARLRGQLEAEAIEVLRQLDACPDTDDDAVRRVEEMVLERRREPPAAAAPACPRCGAARAPEALFCTQCGQRLGSAGS